MGTVVHQLPELALADPASVGRSPRRKADPGLLNPYTPRLHRVPAPELSKNGDTLYTMRGNEDSAPLKLRIPPDGSRTERGARSAEGCPRPPPTRRHPAARANSAMSTPRGRTPRQGIQPRPPAGSMTARHANDVSSRAAQRKRSERLHDSYVTAVSKETLLSEQYGKELTQVRTS